MRGLSNVATTRALRLLLVASLAFAAAGCSDGLDEGFTELLAEPETAVDYEPVLIGAPSEEIEDLAEESLEIFRREGDGASSTAFLFARAEGDIETMQKILRSRGYYTATVEVDVRETEPGEAVAEMTIDPGPAFTLTRHDIVLEHDGNVTPPPVADDAAELGSPVGGQALAARIASAESAAVAALRERGYPYAVYDRRRGTADPDAATLEVTSYISTGPSAVFGDVSFAGMGDVEEAYLRSYQTWEPGETFDPEKLKAFQRDLLGTDLFLAASVTPPETPPAGDEPVVLPISATLEERKPRTVAASFRFDTDDGPWARFSFEHRNLFGANETFRAEAEGGINDQRLAFSYREPQWRRPGQDLLASLEFERTTDDAYDAFSTTAYLGLERRLSDKWTVGAGLIGEVSFITDAGVDTEAYLAGPTFYARFDRTDDRLDPTRGERLNVELTPLAGTSGGDFTGFAVIDAEGSIYRRLDTEGRYVAAGFARAGTVLSGSLDDVPVTRRLYAGGGGSVRGYAEDFIGPLDAQNDPLGGRSVLTAGAELRARLYGDFGGVVFVEGGSVSTAMLPDFEEGFQVAAGLGFRYYSPAGPIRLDVGFPLNGRRVDDTFQIYFSIGQAF